MNKKIVARYYAAWNKLNTDDPAEYYAKDVRLVFFDVSPLKYNSWAEYKKGVEKHFFEKISAGRLTPHKDLNITRRGNIAWMTLTFRLWFTLKRGAAMEMDCRHTAIWERRRGKWLIVHEHISAPLAGQG